MSKTLVVDAGGRGHALCSHLARSREVKEVIWVPGNAGVTYDQTGKIRRVNFSEKKDPLDEICEIAAKEGIELAVIGQEKYLRYGLRDKLEEVGVKTVGPKQKSTMLEADKAWTKQYLKRIGVDVPEFVIFEQADEAIDWVSKWYKENSKPLAIKASGLAEGKGTRVCWNYEQARCWIETLMVGDPLTKTYQPRFGDAGKKIVVEEGLVGKDWIEIAYFALVDEKGFALPFGTAYEDKRAFDGNEDCLKDWNLLYTLYRRWDKQKPPNYYRILSILRELTINLNTGGMICIAPHPLLDEKLNEKIMKEFVEPVVRNCEDYDIPRFQGVLYFQLMFNIRTCEAKVLEINVRHGDIEAQVILERLESELFPYLKACVDGDLAEMEKLSWKQEWSYGIALVSGSSQDKDLGKEIKSKAELAEDIAMEGYEAKKDWNIGYPYVHLTNQPIDGLEKIKDVKIYHNGTEIINGKLLSTGGRVLTLVYTSPNFEEAKRKVDEAAESIQFSTKRYRREPIPKDKLDVLLPKLYKFPQNTIP